GETDPAGGAGRRSFISAALRRTRACDILPGPSAPPLRHRKTGRSMLLMIDNYDSFTFNLVQYLQTLGAEVKVVRNDALTVGEIDKLAPERIMISPGPGTPSDAGVSLDVIRELGQ